MIDENVIAVLKESLGDDGTIIRQLIDLYATDSPKMLVEAATALEQRDAETLARSAHSLKSTSASMGATTATEAARALEVLAKSGDFAQVPAALAHLKSEVNSAIAVFAQLKF
jgi:HPt (histidine-containing phosphotransfer) domain-containing protein